MKENRSSKEGDRCAFEVHNWLEATKENMVWESRLELPTS
jgi:hypothetical protein